mmetsp:Transcript_12017/g.23135  ORF Transcript_12017/g.23135 Transcript_12017/m.23135 type:complete len:86 (+) Transcript_12017:1244-1501(+)
MHSSFSLSLSSLLQHMHLKGGKERVNQANHFSIHTTFLPAYKYANLPSPFFLIFVSFFPTSSCLFSPLSLSFVLLHSRRLAIEGS